jgi:hypothetical protein
MVKLQNGFFRALFVSFFIIFTPLAIFSQKAKQEEKAGINEKLWYGINIRNIGIGGSTFEIGLGLMGGMKVTNSINVGLITHGNYQYRWSRFQGDKNSFFDFGIGALTTVHVYRNFFAQAEVDRYWLDNSNSSQTRNYIPYTLTYLGAGYKYSSRSKWATTITILYNLNPDSNRAFFPLDYRLAFVYNF